MFIGQYFKRRGSLYIPAYLLMQAPDAALGTGC